MNIRIKQIDWIPMGAVRWESCLPHAYVIRLIGHNYNTIIQGCSMGMYATIDSAKMACQMHYELAVFKYISVISPDETLVIELSNGDKATLTA